MAQAERLSQLDEWLRRIGCYVYKEPLKVYLGISNLQDISDALLTQKDVKDFVDLCEKSTPNAELLMPLQLRATFKREFWKLIQNVRNTDYGGSTTYGGHRNTTYGGQNDSNYDQYQYQSIFSNQKSNKQENQV